MAFLAFRMGDYWAQIDVKRFDVGAGCAVAILALAYGLSNLMLARAWANLLAFKNIVIPWSSVLRIYGFSQLAKYVPGNIFHLAGRQSLGLAAGMPGWALAKSTLWELVLISFAGAMFGLLALPLAWPKVSVPAVSFGFSSVFMLATVVAGHLLGRDVARALVWHMSFLMLSGAIFLGALMVTTGNSIPPHLVPVWGAAYLLAWLAGLVTPGAPAGLGVREAVLLFLLAGRIAAPDLLIAVLLGRIITVTGDAAFFVMALALGKRSGTPK